MYSMACPDTPLDSGHMPIDLVQKFIGHQRLSITQIGAETSMRMLGDN